MPCFVTHESGLLWTSYDGDGILDTWFIVRHAELLKAVDTTECLRDITSVGDYVCPLVRLGSCERLQGVVAAECNGM